MSQAEPVLEGWFTLDTEQPHLFGSRCCSCGTYYFPKQERFCRNPECDSESFESVPLSRTGRLWSYTNASYAPPPPFVAADPYVPFAIAAVELDRERMIVLGPVIEGVSGAYFEDCNPVNVSGDHHIFDVPMAERLWAESELITAPYLQGS